MLELLRKQKPLSNTLAGTTLTLSNAADTDQLRIRTAAGKELTALTLYEVCLEKYVLGREAVPNEPLNSFPVERCLLQDRFSTPPGQSSDRSAADERSRFPPGVAAAQSASESDLRRESGLTDDL